MFLLEFVVHWNLEAERVDRADRRLAPGDELSRTGLGIGYISPASILIHWFPDRPVGGGSAQSGSTLPRAIEDGERAVRVFVHAHPRVDVVVAARLRRDVQEQADPAHAVVSADLPLLLDAQHLLERRPGVAMKAAPGSAAGTAKRAL